MRCLYLLLVLCGLLSCKNTLREEVKNSSSLYYLEIDKPNFNSLKPLLMSEFVDSIEYVQLEATLDCLLPYDGYPSMSEVGDFLFINGGPFLKFDVNTGKFLCQIGRYGQGPGEYVQVNESIDKDNNIVYVKSPNKESSLLSYNFNGDYLGDMLLEDTENFSFSNCFYSLRLGFINNQYAIFTSEVRPIDKTCHPFQLIVYDHKNKKMKHTLNNQMEPVPNFHRYVNMSGMMYALLNCEDIFYYRTFYNDTLYSVHLENGIEPYAIIDLGKRKYPVKELFSSVENIGRVGKIWISKVYINSNCILLECMLMNDESSRDTSWFVYKFDLHTKESTYHSSYLLNDLDGGDNTGLTGLSRKIIPVKRLDMDVSKIERKALFSNLKKSELKYPELKDKYDVMQSKRDPDDNPLLMKLKFKKN